MSFQQLFLAELGVVYILGAITGPVLARFSRRLWRRLRGNRSRWDGYFKN